MDITKAKKMVLNWINQADCDDKHNFMRSICGALPVEEVKTFQNMCNKTRRVSKRKQASDHTQAKQKIRVVSVPPLDESVPPGYPNGWWSRWKKEELVAIDAEHVHLKALKGEERIKAGTVSIVNYKREVIYHARIKRERGSFLVNKYTLAKNGFKEDSLVNGRPIDEVRAEIAEILKGKLVISFQGTTDFESVDLNAGDFDHFDLSEIYKRPKFNKNNIDVGEKINLRSLYYHFFKEDIQSGIHSCEVDAKATIRLFLDNYVHDYKNIIDRHHKNFALYSNVIKIKT